MRPFLSKCVFFPPSAYTANDPVNNTDPTGRNEVENFFRQLFGAPSGQFERAVLRSVDNTPTDVPTQGPSPAVAALGEMAVATATGITEATPEVLLTAATGGTGQGARVSIRTAASLPVVKSAAGKLGQLGEKFSMTAKEVLDQGMKGTRFVDNANAGNVNILSARPDGGSGMLRVTLDPKGERVISAGLMRSRQVEKAIENGRLQEVKQACDAASSGGC